MLLPLGFEEYETPGFLAFSYGPNDLRVFTWSNRKVADRDGIPRSYAVLCFGFGTPDQFRVRVPLVEWPSAEQAKRPWPEVQAEIETVFLPLLNLRSSVEALAVLDSYDQDRYSL